MKHAILVMGHGDLSIVKEYMRILDDPRFDFYVHIDSKSNNDGSELQGACQHSKMVLTERIPVYWGHHSQTRTEVLLLKAAFAAGVEYDYFHLISSVDMPLMTPSEIDEFFTKNAETEYVRIFNHGDQHGEGNWRMTYRYPYLTKYKRSKLKLICSAKKAVLSRILRFPRKKGTNIVRDKGWQVFTGDAWWSFSNGFAREMVNFESEMLVYFTDCYCADECYASTLIKHMPKYLEKHSNFYTREVDWTRGFPYTWRKNDFEMLMNSDAIFARKFDPKDMDIVYMISSELMKRKKQQSS